MTDQREKTSDEDNILSRASEEIYDDDYLKDDI